MNITLAHPLPGSTPTDGFGWRDAIPSIGLPAQLHNGQDYAAPLGTKILAAHDGTVTGVFYDHEQGGGWMVRIAAPFGYTMYGHMRAQSPYVKYGDKVSAGDVIGEVGATGIATGAHLHFMLVIDGEPVDPTPYLINRIIGDEEMQFIGIAGKAGARRGGIYAVVGTKAVFIGNPKGQDMKVVWVSDERAIRELQSLISGLA